MKTILKPLFFAAMISSLNAEDAPTKLDSLLEYKNVTITKIEPDGIRIMHESGAARIPYEKIPEDLRTKLGMTQDGVDVHRDKVRDQQQRSLNRIRRSKFFRMRVSFLLALSSK